MITRIPNPEAVKHSMVGGQWPHGMQPISVHFLKRTRQRRLNVTAALTRLTKLPPVIRYEGRLYMPDPQAHGGPFQEKHTAKEYVWIVKAWTMLAEGADPEKLGLSVKPVAVCAKCSRQWSGSETLCPPCMAQGVRGAIKASRKTNPLAEAVEEYAKGDGGENLREAMAASERRSETLKGIGREKTEPPPDTLPGIDPSDEEPTHGD